MVNLEKLMGDIRLLSQEQLGRLQEEIFMLRSGIEPTDAQSTKEFAPIDVPIEFYKDKETGSLSIRYPFVIGLRSNLGWRELAVTQAAQLSLLHIFSESLKTDEQEGRTPPTKATIQ